MCVHVLDDERGYPDLIHSHSHCSPPPNVPPSSYVSGSSPYTSLPAPPHSSPNPSSESAASHGYYVSFPHYHHHRPQRNNSLLYSNASPTSVCHPFPSPADSRRTSQPDVSNRSLHFRVALPVDPCVCSNEAVYFQSEMEGAPQWPPGTIHRLCSGASVSSPRVARAETAIGGAVSGRAHRYADRALRTGLAHSAETERVPRARATAEPSTT